MRKIFLIVTPLFFALLVSCSKPQNSEKQNDSELANPTHRKINLEETESLNPQFKVKKYVALEVIPASCFAAIDKLIINDSSIYIMDAFVKKKFFHLI